MKRPRTLEEAKQHKLTDFLRRALIKLISASILGIFMLLVAFWLKLCTHSTQPHSKTSLQNSRLSKPRSTAFMGIAFRRTRFPEISPTDANLGLGWPDSSTLRTYYTKPPPKPEPQIQESNCCLNSKQESQSSGSRTRNHLKKDLLVTVCPNCNSKNVFAANEQIQLCRSCNTDLKAIKEA